MGVTTAICASKSCCSVSASTYLLTAFRRTSVQWSVAGSLFIATVIRVALVVISYGCKVPCGIFVPSMAVGATFGRMVGIVVKALWKYVKSYASACNG